MYKYIIICSIFFNCLYAFVVEPINEIEDKKLKERTVAEDGKKIYPAIHIPISEHVKVPVVHAIGEKPKASTPKQEVQKPQPIDKTKHFIDKNELKEQEVKQEKIKLDEGKAFFETLNKKDDKPIDIEK
jgi:hypothetical protein